MSSPAGKIYDFSPFRLDTSERRLLCDGEPVALAARVFDTLLVLVENRGRLIEKREMMERVWPDSFVDESSLTQNISLLRKALREGQNGFRFIETVPKRGYRFVAAVVDVQEEQPPINPDSNAITSSAKRVISSTGPVSPVASRASNLLSRIKEHRRAALVVAVAIVLVLSGGWWVSKYLSPRASLPFNQRDWVLIANMENRTGDSVFDGTIEYAVERELSNSEFVNVVPRERIEDALRLMKRPTDTKVDLAIGKEVCLRDGGIRALLTGRTDKLGASYVLSASLVDPREGQTVATRSEEASDEQQVAPAVRRLSNWVRGKLGEALPRIQHSDQELEKVTTPSLKALHLYTQAEAAIRQRGAKSDVLAEQLYRQAIVEDPDFASAYIMLAWAVRNQGKPEAEWKPPSQRALELSEKVSERERYFIQGSYYSMRDEDGKAAAIYEALLQRYPDHYWGRNNLARACNYKLRRFQDALTHYMYRADLRPNDFFMQIDAAETASRLRRMDEAFRYAKRANDLITSELPKNSNYALAWLQFFLTVESYLRGDLEASLGEVDRLAQTVDTYTGRQRDGYANFASLAYLRFGKLRTATEFAQRMSLDDNSSFNLGLIAFTRGDNESLRKSLKEHLNRSRVKDRSDVLPFLIRSGLLAEAQKFISKPSLKGEDFVKVCQGEIALVEGHPERAIPLLRDGITSLRASGNFIFLCAGADSLATAYERQNNTPESIRVLEDSTRDTGLGGSDRVLWLRNKARLAQLYRKVGRVEDALRVEADLLSVLRFADSNHPILIQIHRARSKEPSGPKKAIIRGAHPL